MPDLSSSAPRTRNARTGAARGGRSAACAPRRDRRRGAACGRARTSTASGQSSETPAPPKSWIARSITVRGEPGRDHLDRRDLEARALVADGVHQPRRLQREQARLLDLDAATRRSAPGSTPWSASGLPNATRICARLHISSSARSAMPIARMQWWMRPGPSRACAIANPPPSSPSMFSFGTRTFSNSVSQWPPPCVVPEHGQRAHDRHARRVQRHEDHDCRRCGSASGSVTPMRIATLQRADAAPLVHHLCALIDVVVAVALDAALRCWWRRSWRPTARSSRSTSGSRRRAAAASHCSLLERRAELGEDLHVAGVGRRAVRRLRRERAATHDLAQRRVLEVGQPGAVRRRRAGTGSTARACVRLGLQLLHHRRVEVRVARRAATCSRYDGVRGIDGSVIELEQLAPAALGCGRSG